MLLFIKNKTKRNFKLLTPALFVINMKMKIRVCEREGEYLCFIYVIIPSAVCVWREKFYSVLVLFKKDFSMSYYMYKWILWSSILLGVFEESLLVLILTVLLNCCVFVCSENRGSMRGA